MLKRKYTKTVNKTDSYVIENHQQVKDSQANPICWVILEQFGLDRLFLGAMHHAAIVLSSATLLRLASGGAD